MYCISVLARGPDQEGLEEDAFRQAREFFRKGTLLRMASSYSAYRNPDGSYIASILVRSIPARHDSLIRRTISNLLRIRKEGK